MSITLLVWLIVSVIFEHLIVVATIDVKTWKVIPYYLVVGPYRALIVLREWIGKRAWFEGLSNWFKR